MKRFLCVLVALSILCLNVLAFAEDTATNCTCCNCQNQDEQAESDSDNVPGVTEEMSPEEKYETWLTVSWALLYSRYAEATWFSKLYGYDFDSGSYYANGSFLLLDNIFQVSDEDINNVYLSVDNDEDNLNRVAKTYSFIKHMPSTAETITSTREVFENNVPSGYETIDTLIMSAVSELLEWRNTIPKYMDEHNGTLEDFESGIPLDTKKKINILNYLFTIKG